MNIVLQFAKMKILLILIIVSLSVSHSFSQNRPARKIRVNKGLQVILKDTTFVTERDTVLLLNESDAENLKIKSNPYLKSSKFYDSLERKASSRKITDDIFDLVIRKKGGKERLVNAVIKSEEVFKPFAGRTIGSIVFKSVDLLEGSVIDTLRSATTRFGKFVNKIHADTREIVLKQNLLFDVGDLVDPYQLADNERILRQFKTLRDARIYLSPSKDDPKVVDVVVVTQDVASIGASGSYSSLQKFRIDLYDINLLGYAKQLQVSYFRSGKYEPQNGYEVTLREQNLFHSFVQGELQYTENFLRQRTRVSFGRDFFTPEIKYAGGVELYRTREKFYIEEYDTLDSPYSENYADLWVGRSFEIHKRMNLIFAVRSSVNNFIDRPFVSVDSNTFFYDRTFILGALTLTKRNYLKSLRIRGFGRTEDIPVGSSLGLLLGKEFSEFIDRPYVEVNATQGKYFARLGYINIAIAMGSFFSQSKVQDGLLTLNTTYFSDLVKLPRAQVRQFVYFSYLRGFNRSVDRTVSLDGRWHDPLGIPPLGNERVNLGLETVYFMPWYVYGFQFALYHRIDLNLISESKLFAKASFFPAVRLGVRVLNENLVLPRFSFNLGYYARNGNYSSKWEFKFMTTLPDLFGTSQVFKPQIAVYN